MDPQARWVLVVLATMGLSFATPGTAQIVESASPSQVTLTPGAPPVTVTLRGSGLFALATLRVVRGDREVDGLTAAFGRDRSDTYATITVWASTLATPVAELRVVARTAADRVVAVPLRVTVRPGPRADRFASEFEVAPTPPHQPGSTVPCVHEH